MKLCPAPKLETPIDDISLLPRSDASICTIQFALLQANAPSSEARSSRRHDYHDHESDFGLQRKSHPDHHGIRQLSGDRRGFPGRRDLQPE